MPDDTILKQVNQLTEDILTKLKAGDENISYQQNLLESIFEDIYRL